ncbi:hypothetical protein SHIRM173S_13302 [Streptomyces hirsutus]
MVVQQAEAVAGPLGARLIEHTVADYQTPPTGRLLGSLPEVRPTGQEQERGHLERLASVPEYLARAAERHRAGRPPGGCRSPSGCVRPSPGSTPASPTRPGIPCAPYRSRSATTPSGTG